MRSRISARISRPAKRGGGVPSYLFIKIFSFFGVRLRALFWRLFYIGSEYEGIALMRFHGFWCLSGVPNEGFRTPPFWEMDPPLGVLSGVPAAEALFGFFHGFWCET